MEKTFETYDDTITVEVPEDSIGGLLPGLIELRMTVRYEDEPTKTLSMNLDSTLIDGLVIALLEAKKVAEVGLEEYNYPNGPRGQAKRSEARGASQKPFWDGDENILANRS